MPAASQLEFDLVLPLPRYTLRRSARARYLSVSVTPQLGVMVTLPNGLDPAVVEPFLLQNRAWLEQELSVVEQLPVARERGRLPQRIELPALQRSFEVEYRRGGHAPRLSACGENLCVSGNIDAGDEVCRALRRWLSALAKRELTASLTQLSSVSGLSFTRLSIRGQRGRWGSGSIRGTINLNYKLLFLSPALVEYVLLHELTHTLYPDHSARFWRHLRGLLPDCRQRHAALQQAGADVPWWVEQ